MLFIRLLHNKTMYRSGIHLAVHPNLAVFDPIGASVEVFQLRAREQIDIGDANPDAETAPINDGRVVAHLTQDSGFSSANLAHGGHFLVETG